MKTQCFRDILNQELKAKQERNRCFSLRAFARQLKMSPSHLSSILSGKTGLSPNKAVEICSLLNYTTIESNHFCQLVEKSYSRRKTVYSENIQNTNITVEIVY